MGHYDSSYEEEDDRRREKVLEIEMKARRKALDELAPVLKTISKTEYTLHVPDRFLWALQDYERWLKEDLAEWEKEHLVKKLKGK